MLTVQELHIPIPNQRQSKNISSGENISSGKNMGDHCLVSQVDFDLACGEILAIIGPNGAGKSSILKAIQGELAYSGEISLPTLSSDPKLRARQMGVLPQQTQLNFPFTVAEVVELGRIPHATGKSKDLEFVSQALELMDISHMANRDYTSLSGGEKQRVQLARVFCQIWEPEDQKSQRILLLDEPSSALDLGHQHHLMRAIRHFSDQNVAIIVVMHDINLAARYADKMLAMLCSEQIAIGRPEEVVNQPTMEKLFGLEVEVLNSQLNKHPILIGA